MVNLYAEILFEGPGEADSGWSCTAGTLYNPISTAVCSACGAKKDLDDQGFQTSPSASPRRAMLRQQSINSESRRIRDEKQAKEQWINVVQYCKSVCVTD